MTLLLAHGGVIQRINCIAIAENSYALALSIQIKRERLVAAYPM